jgi:hypothetical protein
MQDKRKDEMSPAQPVDIAAQPIDIEKAIQDAYAGGLAAGRAELDGLVAAAYERGHNDGAAAAQKLPLFEAAAVIMRTEYDSPDEALGRRLTRLQKEYGEALIQSDVSLLFGLARRARTAAHAYADSGRSKPRTPKPTPASTMTGESPRKQTEYELVSA